MKNKILLVEDEKDILRTVSFYLQTQGYEVDCETDGAKVLERLSNKDYDVILLDLRLPNRDGVELCRDIKSNPGLKNIPLVILTALTKAENRESCVKYGADAYIIKPFDIDELSNKIKELLNRELV